MNDRLSLDLDNFSLTKGGPFFKLIVRSGLIKPDFAHPARRAAFLALFTWLPMLILWTLQRLTFGGPLEVSFIRDFTVHVRFLISVPLLIIAEVVLDARTNAVVKHFFNSGLVQEKDYPAFESAVQQAGRLRDSLLAEVLIVGLVIVNVIFNRVEYVGSTSTWQVLVSEVGRTRTFAGWWYLLVGIPFFQFLLGRWLWSSSSSRRWLIWRPRAISRGRFSSFLLMPKSRVSLKVVSVRRARPRLKLVCNGSTAG